MRLPKPNNIQAEKYVAGLSLFKQKVAKTKLSANESALGPSPKAIKEYLKVSKNFELNHNNYWKIDDSSNDDQLKAITGICLMFGFLLVMGIFANLNLI